LERGAVRSPTIEPTLLYDAPGPRARRRNRVIGIVGSIVLLGAFAFVVYRFAETGQFSATKWSIFEYAMVQRTIWNGYLHTLQAAALASVLALALGAVLAAGRLSDRGWIRGPAFVLVEGFRAIPLLLLMFLFYYGLPQVGLRVSPFLAVVLGLTLYNGSVLAEIFRSGVEAVPRGQSEAALSIGLRKRQVMTAVLLPQAIRTMLPAIISQLVVLLKDTALGFLVTYPELLKELKQLATAGEFEFPLIPLVIVGGTIYIATCMVLAAIARWAERRVSRPRGSGRRASGGRRPLDPAARAELALTGAATGE
jgi:glutamate transport system permease protein